MIKYSTKNSIGVITLSWPEKRNALHPEMIQLLKEKIEVIKNDDDVKVLIITGEGTSFCAGADLSYLKELADYSTIENEKDSESIAELFYNIYNFPKPVIAAVNGPAIAGGCGLATVCDFIIADKQNAKFGYTEVKIGFIPAVVSIFLIKKIGEGLAKQLLISGEIINSEDAYRIKLVNYLSDDVLNGAVKLAESLIKNSLSGMILTKKMINSISGLPVKEAVNYSVRLNTISRSTRDFKEGLNNFLNKKRK